MLAANQVMIGKCFKIKYTWKRSSVQVQSKRNFLNVSNKMRKKPPTKFLEPCLHKNKVFQHHYKEMGLPGVDLSHLLMYTPKSSKRLSDGL